MASSRILPVAYNESTYDSAGGQDYSVLNTWEAATDTDLVTATDGEVLRCYAGAHDDGSILGGATCNSSYFRAILPAAGEGHSGVPKDDGTVVEFHTSSVGDGYIVRVNDTHAGLYDLCITRDDPDATYKRGLRLEGSDALIVGCLIWGFAGRGISVAAADVGIINCLFHDLHRGIVNHAGGTSTFVYNATENGCSDASLRVESGGTVTSKNCIWDTALDISGTHNTTTNITSTPTYEDSANDDFRLDSTDTTAKDQGTDLSSDSVFAFDDDILGNTRSGTWDVGFHEYIAAGPTYTLTAESGSLTLSGSSAGLLVNRLLTAEPGGIALTGQDATLLFNRRLVADAGALSMVGQDADLLFNRALNAEAGSINLAGSDADLLYHRALNAEPGTVALTGNDASLLYNRRLLAETGSIALTGFDVTLTYSGAGGPTYTLTAEAGSLLLTGQDATLLFNRRINAEAGSMSMVGQSASLILNRVLSAESGSINLSGQDVSLLLSRVLTAESGNINLTGSDASLLFNRLLSAESGNITLTGLSADLLLNRVLSSEPGSIVLTGQDATLTYSGATLPQGVVTVSLSAAKPSMTITAAKPGISITAAKPSVTIN